DTLEAANNLLNAIENRHAPIRKAFYSDAGVRLMFRDSQIAEGVLLELARAGTVALPVHDSFIVAEEKASDLAETMEKNIQNAKLSYCQVSASTISPISSSYPHMASEAGVVPLAPSSIPGVVSGFLTPLWNLPYFCARSAPLRQSRLC